MKKLSIALPALAMALAIAPAAMADSYTYTINGTNFSATLYLEATGNNANEVPTAGTDTITSVEGTFKVNGTTYTISSPVAPETAGFGANASSPSISSDGLFQFDNLLYPGASGNGILDWSGLLVENGGYELNLFSGNAAGGGPGNAYFYFADNGSNYSNNTITASGGGPATASLMATPEPGSLLLMGTGLLGLAFLAFRKARASGLAKGCTQALPA